MIRWRVDVSTKTDGGLIAVFPHADSAQEALDIAHRMVGTKNARFSVTNDEGHVNDEDK